MRISGFVASLVSAFALAGAVSTHAVAGSSLLDGGNIMSPTNPFNPFHPLSPGRAAAKTPKAAEPPAQKIQENSVQSKSPVVEQPAVLASENNQGQIKKQPVISEPMQNPPQQNERKAAFQLPQQKPHEFKRPSSEPENVFRDMVNAYTPQDLELTDKSVVLGKHSYTLGPVPAFQISRTCIQEQRDSPKMDRVVYASCFNQSANDLNLKAYGVGLFLALVMAGGVAVAAIQDKRASAKAYGPK